MTKAIFDGLAAEYDSWFLANQNVFQSELKLVAKALGDLAGQRVLSVGCGSGLFESHLESARIEGIEPSSDMAAIAKQRGINVRVSSIEEADLPTAVYDLIYFNGSSSYIPRLKDAYQKAYDALKPGGRLVLFDVPKDSAYGLMYLLALSIGSYEHDYLVGTMPPVPYPLELVKSACWHTTREKLQILRDLGMTNIHAYQTLLNNPVFSNDQVEEPVDGYQAGSYVALIAQK